MFWQASSPLAPLRHPACLTVIPSQQHSPVPPRHQVLSILKHYSNIPYSKFSAIQSSRGEVCCGKAHHSLVHGGRIPKYRLRKFPVGKVTVAKQGTQRADLFFPAISLALSPTFPAIFSHSSRPVHSEANLRSLTHFEVLMSRPTLSLRPYRKGFGGLALLLPLTKYTPCTILHPSFTLFSMCNLPYIFGSTHPITAPYVLHSQVQVRQTR